ncbi:MAG: SRPBCC domain-containing protein [Cyclobacteriaceae bacterium]
MAFKITTSIDINASAESVWQHLTDFENYPKGNPFIKEISGKVAEGNTVRVTIEGMNFKPRVLSYKPPREFIWKGKLFTNLLFSGTHGFEIVMKTDRSCTFIHTEVFSGLLVPMMKKKLSTETREGFEAMNQALKQRVEINPVS